MFIPVLNCCTDITSSIDRYLVLIRDLHGNEDIGFTSYNSFAHINQGIVFVGAKSEKSFPRLSNDYGKRILYIYLIGHETMLRKMDDCEINFSSTKPEYCVQIKNFNLTIEILELMEKTRKCLTDYKESTGEDIIARDVCHAVNVWHDKKVGIISSYINMINGIWETNFPVFKIKPVAQEVVDDIFSASSSSSTKTDNMIDDFGVYWTHE